MPTWPAAARNRLKELSEEHKSQLRAIADVFAAREGVDSVSQRHVNDAHSALGQVGLRLRPWYRRTELETAAGGLFLTAAAATPDVLTTLVEESPRRGAITSGILIGLTVVGCALIIHAWFRGLLPTKS